MKIYQSWKRNKPDTQGYSITVTITYSSSRLEEIEELEKKMPEGMLVMNTDIELPKEHGKQTEYDPKMPCNKKGCDAQTRASCCGCPEQLEYERKKKLNSEKTKR